MPKQNQQGERMAKYRDSLPQLGGALFLTDGGIETTLIFRERQALPDFAAFHLLQTAPGFEALRKYFRSYAEIARRFGTGLILESATWRASADWGTRLGYTAQALAQANYSAIRLLEEVRHEHESCESGQSDEYDQTALVISGCIGPRGDGYVPAQRMSEQQAESYHRTQVEIFADSAADMLCAITMNYAEEAVGIARAAREAHMPLAISFTVETDGKLPTGQTLQAALAQVERGTENYPSYYMINCAHPSHFSHVLASGGTWLERLHGLRANASRKSHAELNESAELDDGNPVELGAQYAALRKILPHLNVMGGCCGTDQRHIEQIAVACLPLFQQTRTASTVRR